MLQPSQARADVLPASEDRLDVLGRSLFAETGSLDAGKYCDLAIWNIEQPAELVYRMGFNPLHARIWHGQSRADASGAS